MNRILFGGTFDPFHNGHYQMIISAVEYIKSKSFEKIEVIIIPTYRPYYKSEPYQKYDQRFEICEKVALKLSKEYNDVDFLVSDIDSVINTNYFIDTAKYFYSKNKNYILIGEDEYIKFDTWKDYKDILDMYTLLVVERENKIPCIKLDPVLDISSSKIRENPSLLAFTPQV